MGWYDAFWNAAHWFGGNWFGGSVTTHTGSGSNTTPAVVGSGTGTAPPSRDSGGEWAALLRQRRLRRRRHRASGSAVCAAVVSHGQGLLRHRSGGAPVATGHAASAGAGRRRLRGAGHTTGPALVGTASGRHHDLIDDLMLVLASDEAR